VSSLLLAMEAAATEAEEETGAEETVEAGAVLDRQREQGCRSA
jgi:hypothetical protein